MPEVVLLARRSREDEFRDRTQMPQRGCPRAAGRSPTAMRCSSSDECRSARGRRGFRDSSAATASSDSSPTSALTPTPAAGVQARDARDWRMARLSARSDPRPASVLARVSGGRANSSAFRRSNSGSVPSLSFCWSSNTTAVARIAGSDAPRSGCGSAPCSGDAVASVRPSRRESKLRRTCWSGNRPSASSAAERSRGWVQPMHAT